MFLQKYVKATSGFKWCGISNGELCHDGDKSHGSVIPV